MKTDWYLLFTVIFKNYKYHIGMCLLILGGYLHNEFIPSEDHYTLWYTHGPISLIIPFLVVTPLILMLNHSVKHYKSIKKYYPEGYKNNKTPERDPKKWREENSSTSIR